METRDPDFVAAMREVFQEAADKMLANPDIMLRIEQLWLKAIWKERERLFQYMGREEIGEAFGDKQRMFQQLRWIVGNGTYNRDPDLSVIPPFLTMETEKAALEPSGDNFWKATLGQQVVAHVEREDDTYWVTLFDMAGTDQRAESFDSFQAVQEFLETAFRMLSKGLHTRGYTRPDPQDPTRTYVEDQKHGTWGTIVEVNDTYMATLYGEPEDIGVFDSQEAAERWMWMKIAKMQKSGQQGTKVA